MPAFLKYDEGRDVLLVSLGGMPRDEFTEALARVKAIPGRRFNADTKDWEFPSDADSAMRIMSMLEPTCDAAVHALVSEKAAAIADDLLTATPDDAALTVPWASQLWPFQRSGIDLMVQRRRTILGDEMGLGKTVQALSVAPEFILRGGTLPSDRASSSRRQYDDFLNGRTEKQVICVVPKAVFGTWQEEVDRWIGPREPAAIIDGNTAAKRLKQIDAAETHLILNYEQFRGAGGEALVKRLSKVDALALLLDEAHRIKNPKAQQTKGVTRLGKALTKTGLEIVIPMTGTPVMANPGDLYTLLRMVRPEQYTSYWAFYHSYIDSYQTSYGREMTGLKNVDALRFELSDKMIRRTKKKVLKDLPEKLPPQHVPVPLTPQQRKLYEAAEREFFLDVAKWLQENPDVDPDDLATMDLGALVQLIPNGAARTMRLRQIASSPALLGGPDDSAKFTAAEEIIRDNPGKPFVIFTWFTESAALLANRLRKGKPALKVGVIAGDADPTPVKNEFQQGELDIVVCTIAKGGVGLTLTRASTAIFVERDWTPAINEQAEDRLHRIGQKDPVNIVILEGKDTIDTGIVADANRFKSMIAAQVLGD